MPESMCNISRSIVPRPNKCARLFHAGGAGTGAQRHIRAPTLRWWRAREHRVPFQRLLSLTRCGHVVRGVGLGSEIMCLQFTGFLHTYLVNSLKVYANRLITTCEIAERLNYLNRPFVIYHLLLLLLDLHYQQMCVRVMSTIWRALRPQCWSHYAISSYITENYGHSKICEIVYVFEIWLHIYNEQFEVVIPGYT